MRLSGDELAAIKSVGVVEQQLNVRYDNILAEMVDVYVQLLFNLLEQRNDRTLLTIGQMQRFGKVVGKITVTANRFAQRKIPDQVGFEQE